MRGRVALAVLAALACAGAATAARKPDPAFRLTVTSTYFRHHVTHVVRKRDETGCRWRSDIDTVQTITTSSTRPVRVTLSDLVAGGTDTVPLSVREKRSGTFWYGWEAGCPLLTDQPASRSITSGCGTRRFPLSMSLVSVGYVKPSLNSFAFSYAGLIPDPFRGRCLPDFYTAETGGLSLALPPDAWRSGSTKRKWWTALDRRRLLAGKPVVVRWKDAATISTPATLDPAGYDESVYTDVYSLGWTVTLTPTK